MLDRCARLAKAQAEEKDWQLSLEHLRELKQGDGAYYVQLAMYLVKCADGTHQKPTNF